MLVMLVVACGTTSPGPTATSMPFVDEPAWLDELLEHRAGIVVDGTPQHDPVPEAELERRASVGLDPMAENAARIGRKHPSLPWSLEPWPACVP